MSRALTGEGAQRRDPWGLRGRSMSNMWCPWPVHFVVTELTSTGQRVHNLKQKRKLNKNKENVYFSVQTRQSTSFQRDTLVPLASCEWQASRGCGRYLLPHVGLCTEVSDGRNADYSGADSSAATPAADFRSLYRRRTTVPCFFW